MPLDISDISQWQIAVFALWIVVPIAAMTRSIHFTWRHRIPSNIVPICRPISRKESLSLGLMLIVLVLALSLSMVAVAPLAPAIVVPAGIASFAVTFIALARSFATSGESGHFLKILDSENFQIVESGKQTTVKLVAGSVDVHVVGNGFAGPTFLQFSVLIGDGDRRLNLYGRPPSAAYKLAGKKPWLTRAQGGLLARNFRRWIEFIKPFVAGINSQPRH